MHTHASTHLQFKGQDGEAPSGSNGAVYAIVRTNVYHYVPVPSTVMLRRLSVFSEKEEFFEYMLLCVFACAWRGVEVHVYVCGNRISTRERRDAFITIF